MKHARTRLLGIVLVLAWQIVSAAGITHSGDGKSASRKTALGLHIHRPMISPWPEFSVKYIRLWDSGVSWRNMQKTRDSIDFTHLDRLVLLAEQKGVEVTYAFGVTPQWAASMPEEPGAYGPGSASVPADIRDWRAFVRAVVMRYKGRIKNYEIWNEPNWKNFYSGNWVQLAELVQEASAIVKTVDPAAKIVLPALASEHGLTVIDAFLATGVGKHVDVVAFHFYTGHRPPEVLFDMVARLQASLKRVGLGDRPIWNTEFGWLIAGEGRSVDPTSVGFSSKAPIYSAEIAASFIVRALLILGGAGVERNYFYAWDNESMGVFDPKTRRLKGPISSAMSSVSVRLQEGISGCAGSGHIYSCRLGAGSNEKLVVWSDRDDIDLRSLGVGWRRVESVSGDVIDVTSRKEGKAFGGGPFFLARD